MSHLPEELTVFRLRLENAIEDEIAARARTRSRLLLGAASLSVAVVVVVVGLVSALPGPGPSIVERASAALGDGTNTILHTDVERRRVRIDGWVEVFRTEGWQQRLHPYASRSIERWGFPDAPHLKGGRVHNGRRIARFETGEPPGGRGLVALYDARANTIFVLPGRQPSNPGAPRAPLPDASDDIRKLLARGDVVVEGRVRVGGREAIRLTRNAGRSVYLVDAQTYAPIELRETNKRATVTTRFFVYEQLPLTAKTLKLVDLRAQHPSARVVRNRDAYFEAALRLMISS